MVHVALLFVLGFIVSSVYAQNYTVTNFNTVAVGSTAAPQVLTIMVTISGPGGQPSSVSVVTQGNAKLDFTDVGSGSCSTSKSYSAGDTCTVNVQYQPLTPGPHYGAVVLSFGAVDAVQFVYGMSTGSMGVIVPGEITTAVGSTTFTFSGDGGQGNVSPIELPLGEIVDAAGNLYVSDSGNFRIRKVDTKGVVEAKGTIETYVGNGQPGAAGDNGLATNASISNPSSLALDGAGNLYFSDSSENVIRMVDATTHIITTIAGIAGTPGGPPDTSQPVSITGAFLNQPKGLALSPDQILYIADSGNNLIRAIDLKVEPSSARMITTIAGTLAPGFGGNGVPLNKAAFREPSEIALDPNCIPNTKCDLYVADVNNNIIQKLNLTSNGMASVVAGTQTAAQSTFSGDGGPATSAQLQNPEGVAIDLAGNVYIADTENNRIRKVAVSDGTINTIAGGAKGYMGDGENSNIALLDAPSSIAFDNAGNLYFGDLFNNRVRMISSGIANLGDYGQAKNFQNPPLGPDPETFENDGNDVLSSLAFTFLNASLDPATSACLSDTTLNVGMSCTLGIDFAPQIPPADLPSTQFGTNEPGTVTISSNAANSAGVINLSGDVLTVNPTMTTISSTPNPSMLTTQVTFTATVTNQGNGPLTGSVTFTDTFMGNKTMLGTSNVIPASTVNAGAVVFTFSTSALAFGTHMITATYNGDLNNAPTPTPLPSLMQIVTSNAMLALTSNFDPANPPNFPANITFAATLTQAVNPGKAVITFTDTFAGVTTTLGVAPLSNPTSTGGVATLPTSTLAPGVHTITASYPADAANNNPATSSNSLTVTIQSTPTTTTLTNNTANSTATFGDPVTFQIKVTNGTATPPTGNVTFSDNNGVSTNIMTTTLVNGVASLPATLITGTHTLTANYLPDMDNATSRSTPATFVVTPIGTTTTVTGTGAAGAGSSINLVATVTGATNVGGPLTGSVTFFDNGTKLNSTPVTVSILGTATLPITTLSPGQPSATHAITAVFTGSANGGNLNSNYGSSTSLPFQQVVNQNIPQINLSSSSTGNASTAGSPVTFIAAVNNQSGLATPTGTVSFTSNGTSLGAPVAVDASGHATLSSFSNLLNGSDRIVATYSGDTNDESVTSQPLFQTVTKATTTISVTASTLSSIVGAPITLTANLTGTGGALTGTIVFEDAGSTIGTATINGTSPVTATISPTPLSVGSHVITAVYQGDTNNNPSAQSTPITVAVQQIATTTSLVSDSTPGALNKTITFTSIVSDTNGTIVPGGSVNFMDGATLLGTVGVNANGAASLQISTLSLGSHSIVAVYSGDTDHIASKSTPLNQQVLQASQVALSTNKNPSTADTIVTFTATLSGIQNLLPTGSVTFKDGGNVLGTINASAGVASFSTAALAVGVHTITASYGGDANYQSSVSPALSQTVNMANTSVSLTSSANPATAGSSLTFSSTVSGTGGAVSGSVTFTDGATVIGKAGLNASGIATFATTSLSPGQHVITAVYSGDSNNSPNTSAPLHQQVQQVTVTSLTSNANPALTLAPIVITCTVTNGGAQPATGTVTFTDGSTALGSIVLNGNGLAALSLPSLPAGQHSFVATYSGDVGNFPSTATPLAEVVQLRTTSDVLTATTDVVAGASPTNGEELTLISVIRWTGPTTPTGSVVFKLGNTVVGTSLVNNVGVATLVVDLNPGAAQFAANYSGDSVYAASASPATSISSGPPTSFTMKLNPGSVTVASKQSSTVDLTLSSLSGFADQLSLGCLGLPFAATCTFSTDQPTLAANGTQVVHVVIDTGLPLTAGGVSGNAPAGGQGSAMLRFLPLGALLGFGLMRSRRRRSFIGLLLLLCSIGLTLGLSGCGTLNQSSTPAGTYTFKITASGVASGVTQSTPVTLTVQQ